jgi:hypothetical protein
LLVITALLSYLWFKPSKPSDGGNVNNIDPNREALNTRLNNLVNNNIPDNSSDGSDTTVTQLNQYFKSQNNIETKVEEFVEGSSSDLIQTKEAVNSDTYISAIPSILFSSRFFDSFDENGEIKIDKRINQNNQEVIIQQDDSDNIIDTWEKVEVKFLNNNNLNILFGRIAKDSKSIIINTTDNQEINYDLKFDLVNNFTNDNFNWRSRFNSNNQNIEINKIFIKDMTEYIKAIMFNN